jgi:transposase
MMQAEMMKDGEQAVSARETEGARRASGVSPARGAAGVRARRAEAEVPAKATRRQFSAEYKRRILREAEAAAKPGEIGALLRREGLYSSHLITWRRQRSRGELAGLSPKQRGRKAKAVNPLAKRVAELERDKRRLEGKLEQVEMLLEIQKKASQLLEIPLRSQEEDGGD